MKKTLLLICVAIATAFCSNDTKAQAFDEGKIVITAGYGFPSFGKALFKSYESYAGYKVTGVGPLHFKGEFGLSEKIGLGVSVNYNGFKASWTGSDFYSGATYNYALKYSSLSVLARFNIHFGTSEKLDPYWGIGTGYRSGTWSSETNDPLYAFSFSNPIPVGFETTFGIRYYFTENIGLYTEIGIAKSVIQAGLAIKI